MNDKPIPRRLFLKKAAAAGTAAATGLATSPPLAAQTVTARPGGRSADLILSNAKVITIDRDFTIAQAIAIAADRILATQGYSTRLAARRGQRLLPRTKRPG
jgi:hypothetical protein